MMQITGWVEHDGCAIRHIVGADPEDVSQRVALIEKTPRVRIRPAHFRVELVEARWPSSAYIRERWPEHLDWCYGEKGDGPNDPASRQWCDAMLVLLGYAS